MAQLAAARSDGIYMMAENINFDRTSVVRFLALFLPVFRVSAVHFRSFIGLA